MTGVRRTLLRSPIAVVAVFLLGRAFVALVPFGLTGYPDGHLVINDVTLYSSWASWLVDGRFPAADPMWQYPPLAGPIFALGSMLYTNPDIGFMALAFIFDSVTMAALLIAYRRTGNLTGAWLWALAAVIIGPIFLTRFDVIPTSLAVLGLLLLARPLASGALLGIGAAIKVWPALALAAVPRRRLPLALAGAAAAAIVAVTGVWLWAGDDSFTFLRGQSKRGLQLESVGAIPFVIAHSLGAPVETTYRYGSMEISSAGTGFAALVVSVLGLAALGALAVARLSGRLERAAGPDVALTAVAISVVASRVFSPQYMIWLLGIGAVCLTWRETRMRSPIMLLVIAALLAQVLYPPLYSDLVTGGVVAAVLQVLRVGLVVAATVMALRALWLSGRSGTPRARHADDGGASATGAESLSGSTPASRSTSRAEMASHRQLDSIQDRPRAPISRAAAGLDSNSTIRSAAAAASPPGTT